MWNEVLKNYKYICVCIEYDYNEISFLVQFYKSQILEWNSMILEKNKISQVMKKIKVSLWMSPPMMT